MPGDVCCAAEVHEVVVVFLGFGHLLDGPNLLGGPDKIGAIIREDMSRAATPRDEAFEGGQEVLRRESFAQLQVHGFGGHAHEDCNVSFQIHRFACVAGAQGHRTGKVDSSVLEGRCRGGPDSREKTHNL